MTELADVFELLHGADESYRTLRATVRSRCDVERSWEAMDRFGEAWERAGGTVMRMMTLAGPEAAPAPEVDEETVRLWYERPDRLRAEVDGFPPRTVVSDAESTVVYSPRFGPIRGPRGESGYGIGSFLGAEPAALLAAVSFEIRGRTLLAGREAIVVRARPRSVTDVMGRLHGLPGLEAGADRYELLVDAERGLLLRSASVIDGEEFMVCEVLQVAFDERLDPAVFTFAVPPGERVRTHAQVFGRMDVVSIEEAVERAPFTVLAPTGLGAEWTEEAQFQDRGAHGDHPTRVLLHYVRQGSGEPDPERFSVSEQAARGEEIDWGTQWERVERGDLVLFVASTTAHRWRAVFVRLEREGTSIAINSQSLDRERLLEIAESFESVPTEPEPQAG